MMSEQPKGSVYWICHGEILAGVIDVGLTAYGELQGKRANVDLEKKFDQEHLQLGASLV
jgi:hypothetical protein